MPRLSLRRTLLTSALLLLASVPQAATAQISSAQRDAARRIIAAATSNHDAYKRLGDLVDGFGSRITGSVALEKANDWILEEMKADGLQNVRGEPVMVPHWVRGRESLDLVLPRPRKLPMLGLGGSIGTPPEGIRGEVLVVSSYDDLAARADEARGHERVGGVPVFPGGEGDPLL